jgi:hypothetical protein
MLLLLITDDRFNHNVAYDLETLKHLSKDIGVKENKHKICTYEEEKAKTIRRAVPINPDARFC